MQTPQLVMALHLLPKVVEGDHVGAVGGTVGDLVGAGVGAGVGHCDVFGLNAAHALVGESLAQWQTPSTVEEHSEALHDAGRLPNV